jgi:hypothetical protein
MNKTTTEIPILQYDAEEYLSLYILSLKLDVLVV